MGGLKKLTIHDSRKTTYADLSGTLINLNFIQVFNVG